MEKEQVKTINYQLYETDRTYKADSNLIKYVDEAQNFYNGNQYNTTNSSNMIRVTMNICSFSAIIKASKICGTPIYFAFTADNPDTDCTALRRFDEYNCNKMHLKSENFQSALNGFVNGTEVTYIRWDDDDTSYKGIYKGGLVEEHLDLRSLAIANPYIQSIQNQEWIEFWDDVPYSALVDMLEAKDEKEKKKKLELLQGEIGSKYGDEYKKQEHINSKLLRLFTRFFRLDGEVYFMCSTEDVDLFAFPHPLSRKISRERIKKVVDDYYKKLDDCREEDYDHSITDYDIDYERIVAQCIGDDVLTDEEYAKHKEKFSLYPFAVYAPFKQNRSFYGRSDIKSLIPIQKGINFALSMNLKCAENNAYNKIFAKPDALQGQVITNEPSQIIIDYSKFTNGWGLKFAESQPMPNGLLDFVDKLVGMTRIIYGFNDVMDGSISNQDMSGYMLQQMIKQSNTSIEQQQQLFWVYNEEKASIRLMFYKHYVDKAKYTYEMSDADYESEEQARKMLLNAVQSGRQLQTMPNAKKEDFEKPTHKTKVSDIKNEDIYGVNFDISIDAMQGLSDSKLVEQQMWDNLLLNGGINNIDPEILEMYLIASPNVSERTKTALKSVIEKRKMSEITQLKDKLEELSAYAQQLQQYCKQLESQNNYQKSYLNNLNKEFTSKIDQQNQIINGLTKDLDAKNQEKPQMSSAPTEVETKVN